MQVFRRLRRCRAGDRVKAIIGLFPFDLSLNLLLPTLQRKSADCLETLPIFQDGVDEVRVFCSFSVSQCTYLVSGQTHEKIGAQE